MVKPELQDMAQKYDYLFHLFEVILRDILNGKIGHVFHVEN